MTDILLEILRATIVGFIFIFLCTNDHVKRLAEINGWKCIISGFGLIFFGMLIDITDNFPALNHFIFIGDTQVQALLEKVVGYLFGFALLALGIWQWVPNIIKQQEEQERELEESNKQVQELSQLLPICMDCKKTRNDEGYWSQIEVFLNKHTDVQLSHGICDDCFEKRYPEP